MYWIWQQFPTNLFLNSTAPLSVASHHISIVQSKSTTGLHLIEIIASNFRAPRTRLITLVLVCLERSHGRLFNESTASMMERSYEINIYIYQRILMDSLCQSIRAAKFECSNVIWQRLVPFMRLFLLPVYYFCNWQRNDTLLGRPRKSPMQLHCKICSTVCVYWSARLCILVNCTVFNNITYKSVNKNVLNSIPWNRCIQHRICVFYLFTSASYLFTSVHSKRALMHLCLIFT